MDKRKTHKKSKPKRATDGNSTTQDDTTLTATSGKDTIHLVDAQTGATSTDTLTIKEEGSSSSGYSLNGRSSSTEKTKHVSFEEKKSASTSSQSKSSDSSLQSERGAKATATQAESGTVTPAASKTILKKRKKNARRRARKIANQAMNAIKMEEAATSTMKATESSKLPTLWEMETMLLTEPKLKFSDEILQVAECPRKLQGKCASAQKEIEEAALVPDNIEIAARFKQIMDMFDNFTRNLESLDMPNSPRSDVSPRVLTDQMHKQSAIPLGWKSGDGRRNVGSNIDISITENTDKQKNVEVGDGLEKTLKDLKLTSHTKKLKKPELRSPRAVVKKAHMQTTAPLQCEIKDWQTGFQHSVRVLNRFDSKDAAHKTKEPKTLQTIAKEKMKEESTKQAENFADVQPSDISISELPAAKTADEIENSLRKIEPSKICIHTICAKPPEYEKFKKEAEVAKTQTAAAAASTVTPSTSKITLTNITMTTMQADELPNINIDVQAHEKVLEFDKPESDEPQYMEEEPTASESTPKQATTEDSAPERNLPFTDSTDFIIEMEIDEQPSKDFLTEEFEIWKLHHNIYPTGLPKWRQGLQNLASPSAKQIKTQQLTREVAVPAMPIHKDIATSTATDELPCQTVSCQTSLHLQQHLTVTANAPMVQTQVVAAQNLHDDANFNAQMQTTDTDCKVETYLVLPPPDENKTCGKLGPSISRQALVKESPSLMDLPRVMTITQQPERTFHTIHIDTTSTPSPSVLQRPPLGQRCWTVLTDLFNAVCVCLQVNKDCIFCLGFFIAFVVSASFLTAFFYRTLSVTPQQIYHQQQHPPHIPVTQRGNNLYYL